MGRRESVDEVLEHGLDVVERLVQEDSFCEVAADLRAALARLALDVVQRRALVVPHVLVDRRPLRRGRVLAQHALAVGHVESVAVGELSHARIQELPAVPVQPVVAVDRLVPGRVREHRHDESDRERRGTRPTRAQEEQCQECGYENHDRVRPCEERAGEQQPGEPGGDGARRPPPQEQHAPSDQQQLEERLGQDVLLDVELVAVEEHRRRGERGPQRREPQPEQHRVDEHRDREAHEVLHGGHDGELPTRRQQFQEQRIAERPQCARLEVVEPLEIARRVVVDERRPIGEECDHAQHEARGQEAREHGMGADEVPHPGAGPGTGRAANRSTATSANTVSTRSVTAAAARSPSLSELPASRPTYAASRTPTPPGAITTTSPAPHATSAAPATASESSKPDTEPCASTAATAYAANAATYTAVAGTTRSGATRVREARNRDATIGTASTSATAAHAGSPEAASAIPPSASAAHRAITFSAATVANLSSIRPCTTTTRDAGAHSPPGR